MISSMREAEAYLQQFISQNTNLKFPGGWGLERTRYFLNLLKNPQNKLKIIHIAGTSGKGSTAIYTSTSLQGLGFKTGLHISPYIFDFRERFQLNGQLISEKSFCKYLSEIQPFIEKMRKTTYGKPTYFEILTALAFYIFYKEKVNYAVIEIGLGGLFDATNAPNNKNKLCVLTRIGHDHIKILGKTLDKIAFQKAGIIQKNNKVLSLWQKAAVRKVFEKQTAEKKGKLAWIKKGVNYKNIKLKNRKIIFDFNFKAGALKNICLNTSAFFQTENCALALATVQMLSQRDKFLMDEKKIKEVLQHKLLPARMEKIKIGKRILILDGAHNPQKMKFFLESLKRSYPRLKFSFLLAFKRDKDQKKMLAHLVPKAKEITLTTFKITNQDFLHISEEPKKIAKKLRKLKFSNYKIISDAQMALEEFLKKSSGIMVITGSLYLLGRVYPLIFKNKKVSN